MDFYRFGSAASNGGWNRVGEQLRTAALNQTVNHFPRTGHVPTRGSAERLAQSPGENVDSLGRVAGKPKVFVHAPSTLAQDPDAV